MTGEGQELKRARRDIVALGIAFAALLMFVGTGGAVLPKILAAITGQGVGPDRTLTSALFLNVALVIFGWRRYRELTREVEERRRAEEQSRLLAQTDALTGCLNRRTIVDAATELVGKGTQPGRAVAVAMLDLDNFKRINDVYSHLAGDTLLRTTSERLRQVLPPDALIARMGGDEFACVIPFDPNAVSILDDRVERLIETLRQPVQLQGSKFATTVSVGLSRSDLNGNDIGKLLHMADIAMYAAKRSGRNSRAWFDPVMESELQLRSKLEAGVRHGVAAGEFVPFFEKQVDLATGEIVGFEMLARWDSPTLGRIGPEVFIPVAEELGLIAELSENLIREALKRARNWAPHLTLAINISPVQLRDPWFAQKILKLLVETNFPAHRLEIEITESSLHENIGLVRSMITSLKNQGVRISLDDFGTGYSSLSQLRSLPFDRIKIDRSFVTTLPESEESITIVQSIVSLGEGLGLPITAEGVETEQVLEALKQFEGLKAQGYLYGYPGSAEATEAELLQLDLLRDLPEDAASLSGTPETRQAKSG